MKQKVSYLHRQDSSAHHAEPMENQPHDLSSKEHDLVDRQVTYCQMTLYSLSLGTGYAS